MSCPRKRAVTSVTHHLLRRYPVALDDVALGDFTLDAALSALGECLEQFSAAQRLLARGQAGSGLQAIGRGQKAAAAAVDSLRYLVREE
jgi:hypothetical protein